MSGRVLLTGASGFVGSHVLSHLLDQTDHDIVCLCSFRHRGNPKRITEDEYYDANKDRVEIISCDLTGEIPDLGDFDYILNIASESHVDRSIEAPVPFIENNVKLVLSMLEYARKHPPKMFIQFSTDEVYGPAPEGQAHAEWDTILPSNPYSASKAAQEAVAVSYWRTYGVPVVITNCMNVIGERQDPEKFVPKILKTVLAGQQMEIHGSADGTTAGSRAYLHARNIADALVYIMGKLPAEQYPGSSKPSRYHIAGEKEVNNLDMAHLVAKYVGKPLKYKITDAHSSRPGHDMRYMLDSSKLRKLGWQQPLDLEQSLEKTIKWTLKNPKWLNGQS